MNLRIGILCTALALASLGCSAYNATIERGDAMAKRGDWDSAAAIYESAVRLDPERPEARERLTGARRYQSAARTSATYEHIRRGELVTALDTGDEALQLDPQSAPARKARDAAVQAALQRGEEQLAAGNAAEALTLASRLARTAPGEPRVTTLESRARDAVASAAYARGEAALTKRSPGNALLGFLEAEHVRPGFRDAYVRASAVRRDLETELQFHVVFEQPTSGDPRELAAAVDRELPDKLLNPTRPLLSVERRLPPKGAGGMRVSLKLEGYAAWKSSQSVTRTCSYVCGVDRVPNPEFAAASRDADEASRRVHDADREAVHARRERDRRASALTAAESARDAAQRVRRQAQSDLDQCLQQRAGRGCDEERRVLREAEREHEAARVRADTAESEANLAQRRFDGAESDRMYRQRDLDFAIARVGRTPEINEVTRTCDDAYPVSIYTAQATAGLVMRAGILDSGEPQDMPSVPYRVEHRDETFPPRPGRCAVTASGDPLTLPSEAQLREELAARVVEGVREAIHGSYDAFRQELTDDERRARAAGRADEAQEAHVRALLLGPDASRELGMR